MSGIETVTWIYILCARLKIPKLTLVLVSHSNALNGTGIFERLMTQKV